MTRDERFTAMPTWSQEASTLASFEEGVKLYVMVTV